MAGDILEIIVIFIKFNYTIAQNRENLNGSVFALFSA